MFNENVTHLSLNESIGTTALIISWYPGYELVHVGIFYWITIPIVRVGGFDYMKIWKHFIVTHNFQQYLTNLEIHGYILRNEHCCWQIMCENSVWSVCSTCTSDFKLHGLYLIVKWNNLPKALCTASFRQIWISLNQTDKYWAELHMSVEHHYDIY